ncbi:tryptophan 2,3-dioxygenase family protein [Streptomyces sp. M19]
MTTHRDTTSSAPVRGCVPAAPEHDAEGRVDHDEMVFLVVQKSSELWLKLAAHDLEQALRAAREHAVPATVRMLGRVRSHVDGFARQLDSLDHTAPWAYQRIRTRLENGPGFDSPGWRRVRHLAPSLGAAFTDTLDDEGVPWRRSTRTPRNAHPSSSSPKPSSIWTSRARRGGRATSGRRTPRRRRRDRTRGHPVGTLAKLANRRFHPRLWDVRSHLTSRANDTFSGTARPSY